MIKDQKNQAKNAGHWKLVIVLSLPFIALDLNISGFHALLPFVREEFILSRTQVGYYSTCFFASSALFAVFAGRVVDNLGPRKGVLLGLGFMGLMLLLYGLSISYAMLLFLALLAGLSSSIITPSVSKGVVTGFPPEKRAFSMGAAQVGIGIGGFTGASLLPLLGGLYDWRTAIQFSAVFALLIGFLFYKLYGEQGSSSVSPKKESSPDKGLSLKDSLLDLLRNRQLLQACVLGTVFGASAGAAMSHFAVFLSEDLYVSRVVAGLGFGTFQVGGIIGRPAWGWVSDRLLQGDRRKTLFIMGLAMSAMYLFIYLFLGSLQASLILVFLFSFLLGCSAFGWMGVQLTTVSEFAGEKQAGIASGLTMLFVRIGIFAAPPLFGFIADMRENYEYSWLFFGIIFALASLLYYFGSARSLPPAKE